MSEANSIRERSVRKPYPDFPLTPRQDGRWCKRIRGKMHYFIGSWEDALEEYNRVKDYLHLGKEPPIDKDAVTVRDVVNEFLTIKDHLVASEELKQRTFDEYKKSCERVVRILGKSRLAGDVGPDDFARIRADMTKTLGPVALGNAINRVRSIFKFAYEHRLIDRPVIYGQSFRRPSPKTLRVERAKKGVRLFEPGQVRLIMDNASTQMKAMVLLACNAGFGNADCGQLEFRHIDLGNASFDFPRPKTRIPRSGKLWPETVDALRKVITERREPSKEEFAELVFITSKRGLSWFKETGDNPVAKEFRKLVDELKVYRPGLTFYALRHCFETIAGESGDQVAVNHVMGHIDASMAAVYRERVSDERLQRVAEHVRKWLFGSEVV